MPLTSNAKPKVAQMFHDIPPAVLDRMQFLVDRDTKDREASLPLMRRLRQITPETGQFLALLLAGAPRGEVLEIGTSGGYSTMWLSLACAATSRRVTTFELMPEKQQLARETFRAAGVEHLIELVAGDAREHLPKHRDIAFCFLDAEKEVYRDCYEAVVPHLVPGGILVADNAISHHDELASMLDRATSDVRVDALVVPIGRGELVCRKI
jgi:caffeoyl-CoA O-methyltransferase